MVVVFSGNQFSLLCPMVKADPPCNQMTFPAVPTPPPPPPPPHPHSPGLVAAFSQLAKIHPFLCTLISLLSDFLAPLLPFRPPFMLPPVIFLKHTCDFLPSPSFRILSPVYTTTPVPSHPFSGPPAAADPPGPFTFPNLHVYCFLCPGLPAPPPLPPSQPGSSS